MRAVLDTNILARAVPGNTGPAREVLELMSVPPHLSVTSPGLLDELTRALGYPRLRAITDWMTPESRSMYGTWKPPR